MQRELTADDAARIEARYPKRSPVDMLVGALAGLMVLGAIATVVVAGLTRSNPPVAAMVRAFDVKDANHTVAEVVVQRRDPSVAATCFMYAQAESYERVAELDVDIPPGTKELTVVNVELRTVREATSVSIENCRPVG